MLFFIRVRRAALVSHHNKNKNKQTNNQTKALRQFSIRAEGSIIIAKAKTLTMTYCKVGTGREGKNIKDSIQQEWETAHLVFLFC